MCNRTESIFSSKKILKYRNELFGIAAIWIVVFHVFGYVSFPQSNIVFRFVSRIFSVGNLGVDLFLVFSSIGLCYSLRKNTVRQYYLNRIKRVLIPYIFVSVLFFAWYDFFFLNDGICQYILNVTSINYWITGDYPIWYVSFILVAYILFPLIYKADVKTKHVSTIILIIVSVAFELSAMALNLGIYVNCERALSRIPVFLIGILLFDIVEKDIKIPHWFVLFAFLLTLGCLFFIWRRNPHIICVRYLYGIIAIGIIVVYSWIRSVIKFQFIIVPAEFTGKISFEIYILHICANRIINANQLWGIVPNYLWYLILPLSIVVIAYLYSVLIKGVQKLIK